MAFYQIIKKIDFGNGKHYLPQQISIQIGYRYIQNKK